MRLLVTGANGFIGSRFCEAAAEAGHEVVALVRPRNAGRPLPGAARLVVGQLPYDVPPAALEGCSAVVHGAAVTTADAAGESEAVNLAGTSHLLRLAQRAGVERFVFLSTQSVLGSGESAYAVTKRACEAAVRESGMDYAILRPGLVFGPGTTGLFARMRRTVERLPVLPLLGGGKALVQGVEVSDLCRALLRCLDTSAGERVELNLGDPEGIALADFLQATSRANLGRPKPAVTIPLWPVKLAVSVGEALRLPLPISRDNIRGMETVQRMDTASSLSRLGMTLPPLDEALARAAAAAPAPGPRAQAQTQRPVRIMLVGAGKIGIVHTLSLTRRSGVEFVGIVDRNPGAFGLYQGLGVGVPFETSLDRAVDKWRPDGAVVATPAATHPGLTRELVNRQVGVLVEKPVAIHPAGLEEYRRLLASLGPGAPPIHAGYMAAQYPHLATALHLIRRGDLGCIQRVTGYALQSHIMASKPERWEMIKAKSGGGALINFAGHLLTMIRRLFGSPTAGRSALWSIHSREVEDAGVLLLDYGSVAQGCGGAELTDRSAATGGFEVRCVFSWSMPGYATPENRLIIEGEKATLDLRNCGLALVQGGRTKSWWTQRAAEVGDRLGYNPGPDYTGSGFAQEHRNFARALALWRWGQDAVGWEEWGTSLGPVQLDEALAFEGELHRLYAEAQGPEEALGLAGEGGELRALVERLLKLRKAGQE